MAANTLGGAVYFNHPTATGILVKPVNVLGYYLDFGWLQQHLKLGDCFMPSVWTRIVEKLPHFIVPGPDSLRVTVKPVNASHRHWVNVGPQAVVRIPESRDATFSG
jgi:hypothetical protein